MATFIDDRSTYWVVSGGGSPDSYGDYRYYWRLEYEQSSTDKANNRTKIIVSYYIQKDKSQGTNLDFGYPSGTSTAYINDSSVGSVSSSSGSISTGTSYQLVYLGQRTTYVNHNANGKGSFTFRASGFGKGTSTSTYSLPTIPRNSVLGDISTFTVDNGTTVPITKYVSSYYDKLQIYQLVNNSYTLIKTINGITNGSTVTFSNNELNTIYNNVPSLQSAATLKFTLSSYSDSGYTTQVGTSNSKTVTANLVIVAPTFSGFTYVDSNSQTTALTGNSLMIVGGKSTLKITLTSAQKASANTRQTTISHYIVNNETVAKSVMEGNSGYSIANYPYDNVSVYAVDSRGTASNYVSYSFTQHNVFVPYENVSKSTQQSYSRSDNGVGKFVSVSFGGTWWNGLFGVVENTLYATYKYKKSTEQSYTDGVEDLTLTINGNSFSYNGQIKGDPNDQYGFDISESYDIIITVKDVNKNNPLSSDTITFNVHSGEPALAIYKNKASIGAKYNETLGGIQLWGTTYLNGIELDNSVPSTGETIKVSISEAQTVSTNTNTTILLDNVDYNGSGQLTLSNNAVYIGPGVHNVLVNCRYTAWSSNNNGRYIYVYKNNDIVAFSNRAYSNTMETTIVIPVQENDYIMMKCYHEQNGTISISNNESQTFMQVTIIS